ncbi:MAG TPA: hypothetical protein VMB74_03360 [Streptosporangiaceae bacterium]|nr:hypothetical protein [Streptosporangiaceae bacterium]
MTAEVAGERRAARLLRWYPPSWRARYGEEFAELLLADFAEQPANWRRDADVAAHGLLARIAVIGLLARAQPPAIQLATLGCALATFAALGVAMLAQLATGWQWDSPASPSVAGATVLMTVAAACLASTGLAAGVPVLGRVLLAAVRRDGRLVRPAGLALACTLALVFGARHFQNSWPGTGGTGAEHSLVPGGIAAFGWSSTLSVSTFWVHPALLGRFPAAELAWMAASPVAAVTLIIAAATVVRRLALVTGLVRYLTLLARGACLAAAGFLAGAAIWVVGQGGAAAGLFRPGLVDGGELLIMGLALAAAARLAAALSRDRASVVR